MCSRTRQQTWQVQYDDLASCSFSTEERLTHPNGEENERQTSLRKNVVTFLLFSFSVASTLRNQFHDDIIVSEIELRHSTQSQPPFLGYYLESTFRFKPPELFDLSSKKLFSIGIFQLILFIGVSLLCQRAWQMMDLSIPPHESTISGQDRRGIERLLARNQVCSECQRPGAFFRRISVCRFDLGCSIRGNFFKIVQKEVLPLLSLTNFRYLFLQKVLCFNTSGSSMLFSLF
jgi:hypothetical protein